MVYVSLFAVYDLCTYRPYRKRKLFHFELCLFSFPFFFFCHPSVFPLFRFHHTTPHPLSSNTSPPIILNDTNNSTNAAINTSSHPPLPYRPRPQTQAPRLRRERTARRAPKRPASRSPPTRAGGPCLSRRWRRHSIPFLFLSPCRLYPDSSRLAA